MNSTSLFKQVLMKNSPEQIAQMLAMHPNTVRRWIAMRRVPEHYSGDFKRMLGEDGDVGDQFYTKQEIAKYCYETFQKVAKILNVDLRRYHFIEPSAGCGYFYQVLPRTRTIGIDISPSCAGIEKADYLLWEPKDYKKKYIVIGNPPFGLRGHLALQFINHSSKFADMVAFILPQLFESDGKGVPSKRVDRSYRLAHSERLPANSFVKPDGTPIDINTIFQVWTKINQQNIKLKARRTCNSYMKIYSLSDGGTPASTRNKMMIGKCDVYLPSTCFSGMKAYRTFEALPNCRGYGILILNGKREIKKIMLEHDWSSTAFLSTNGALNLRRSLIEDVITSKGIYDATL